MRKPDELYETALSLQKKARIERQKEVVRAFRYEDYILVIRRDGERYKTGLTQKIIPFPVVMTGKLPHSRLIPEGFID